MRIAKRNLKKQSQFLKGQNDVKSILTMVYGDFGVPRRLKNKANSKPIKANFDCSLRAMPNSESEQWRKPSRRLISKLEIGD